MLLILVYTGVLHEWMFAFLLCGTSESWHFWLDELAGMVAPSKFFIFVFFNVKRWCSSSLLVVFYFLFAVFPIHLLLKGCGQVSKQGEGRGTGTYPALLPASCGEQQKSLGCWQPPLVDVGVLSTRDGCWPSCRTQAEQCCFKNRVFHTHVGGLLTYLVAYSLFSLRGTSLDQMTAAEKVTQAPSVCVLL